ncbi:hypothetical protein [Streptomyces sp. 1222.5]|uniref:hypothetical protein n=1 Tax=Streptomyces sp. 1222.5 TaxID=1881026 RepID=UPI003D709190
MENTMESEYASLDVTDMIPAQKEEGEPGTDAPTMLGIVFTAGFVKTGRGHVDWFIPDGRIRKGSVVLASATEMDSTFSSPLFGGAHVTVQQITPADGSVRVRTWVDNVPVNINLRLQIAVLGTVTVPV